MEEKHIASVFVAPDDFRQPDPAAMFVNPTESSTDPPQAEDPRYVASVFVGGYENINKPPVDHQYAQIGENVRDKTNQGQEIPKDDKDKLDNKKGPLKNKILRVRTLVWSIIISLIVGILIGVFAFLAVQYFNNKGAEVGMTSVLPEKTTYQLQDSTTDSPSTLPPDGSLTTLQQGSATDSPSTMPPGGSLTTLQQGATTDSPLTLPPGGSTTTLQSPISTETSSQPPP